MAKASRKKRKFAKARQGKASERSIAVTIRDAISSSVQVAAAAISIYQALDDNVKTAIKAVFDSVSLSFMRTIEALQPDEQVVQAGKFVVVERKVVDWLAKTELPPMKNTFDTVVLTQGLEQILEDGVAISAEDLEDYLATCLSYWQLSSSLPTANPERPKRRPLKI